MGRVFLFVLTLTDWNAYIERVHYLFTSSCQDKNMFNRKSVNALLRQDAAFRRKNYELSVTQRRVQLKNHIPSRPHVLGSVFNRTAKLLFFCGDTFSRKLIALIALEFVVMATT